MKRVAQSVFLLCVLSTSLLAQTRQQGPWWPSPWGPDDQAGASNRITAEVILNAVQLVQKGTVY